MNPTSPSNANPPFFGQKVSQPGINVTQATPNQLIYTNDYNSTIYYSQNGTPTVLSGLRVANSNNQIGTNQQGFFVSQTDIDVTQATDAQLIFNSQQNVFKIIDTLNMSVTFTRPGSGSTSIDVNETIPHGLSYIPAFEAFITLDPGLGYSSSSSQNYSNPAIPWVIGSTAPFIGALMGFVTVDDQNVYFDIIYVPSKINAGTFNCTATVYLLQETF